MIASRLRLAPSRMRGTTTATRSRNTRSASVRSDDLADVADRLRERRKSGQHRLGRGEPRIRRTRHHVARQHGIERRQAEDPQRRRHAIRRRRREAEHRAEVVVVVQFDVDVDDLALRRVQRLDGQAETCQQARRVFLRQGASPAARAARACAWAASISAGICAGSPSGVCISSSRPSR